MATKRTSTSKPSSTPAFNWYKSCSYDANQKASFHKEAKARLKKLASQLELSPGSFEIRSNQAGIAVSGEITLHHDNVYVQVSQPATGSDTGILIRRCKGRKDYTGERNHFAPLALLDNVSALTTLVQQVQPLLAPPEPAIEDDEELLADIGLR